MKSALVAYTPIGSVSDWKKLQDATVLDDQGVALAAAGGGQQHRLVDQAEAIDQIEQMLEMSGIATVVNRNGDYQQIGGLDAQQFLFDVFRQLAALQRSAERAGDPAQIHDVAAGAASAGDVRDDLLGQRPRA